MKTFGRSVAIFLIFLAGTLSVIHVDRQCQEMEGGGVTMMEEIETVVGATAVHQVMAVFCCFPQYER